MYTVGVSDGQLDMNVYRFSGAIRQDSSIHPFHTEVESITVIPRSNTEVEA